MDEEDIEVDESLFAEGDDVELDDILEDEDEE